MLSFEGCEDQFTSERFDRAFSECDLFGLVAKPSPLRKCSLPISTG
jgi:hypothetical protein